MTDWEQHPLCGPRPHPTTFWGPERLDPEAWRAFAALLEPEAEIAAILEALGDASEVVDVGGGTGLLAEAIAATGRALTIVEPSAEQRAHAPEELRVIAGRAEAVPLGDGACDAALAAWVLQYCDDPDRAVAELARVARRRVVIVQAAPNNEVVDVYNLEATVAGVAHAHHGYLLARAAAQLESRGFGVTLSHVAIPLRAPPPRTLAQLHFAGHPRFDEIAEATRIALQGKLVHGKSLLADDGVILVATRP